MYALLQSLWSFLSFQVSAKRGTIRSHPGVKFDPQKDAEVLRKAMKGIGMLAKVELVFSFFFLFLFENEV